MTNKQKILNKKLLTAAVSATKANDIHLLVRQGADVNCTNEWGMTPLMLAAQYNIHVVVLKALLKEGADLFAVEPKYRSNALHLAANTCSNTSDTTCTTASPPPHPASTAHRGAPYACTPPSTT